MKQLFTLMIILLSTTHSSAQEVGRAGTLIKNEASTQEMKTLRRSISELDTTIGVNKTNANNNRYPSQNRVEGRNPSYQWNYNYGSSEVFLRIPERGFYTVQLDDQMMSSATGKYRFFDVPSGRNMLSIYRNGYLVYRAAIQVQNHTRLLLDFFEGYGLYLLDSYSLRANQYGFNQWDDIWNNSYRGNYPAKTQTVMSARDFDNFIRTLEKNAYFDDDVISYARQQMKLTFFTAEQIKTILGKMSFDKNKILLAKEIYPYCVDPNNFYVIYDTFSFRQSRNEVMDYISRLSR